MRDLVNWEDHIVEYPGRFSVENLGNGMEQLTPAPGTIRKQGTPQNATNFNTMDLAAYEAMLIGNENTRMLMQTMRDLSGVKGMAVDVTLTNTQTYPFNNSKATVTLPNLRISDDYYVVVEVLEANGMVGEFDVSEKLLNGFKLAYTGSATSVKVRCHITGGMY